MPPVALRQEAFFCFNDSDVKKIVIKIKDA